MRCARLAARPGSFARVVTHALFAVALGLGFQSTSAKAQVLEENAWVTNGDVLSVANLGGATYLGGIFSYLGPLTGSCVALDATTGALVPGSPRVNGLINRVVSDGTGGWFIAGTFTSVGGAARPGLARIRADMTLDSWVPDYLPGSDVRDIARSGSTLYACGFLLDPQGGPRFLIAFDITTGQPTAWNPLPDAPVLAVSVSGTAVYVGGVFSSIGGQNRVGLAAIDASTGLATPWNPGIEEGNGYVSLIVPSVSTVYVFGTFDRMGGLDRYRFAAVDVATGMVTNWNPAHDSYVNGAAVDGETVYLTGGFTTIGGESRAGIAAFDATTAAVLPWRPGSSDGGVSGIHLEGSRIFVTGEFSSIDGLPRSNIAELDPSTAAVTPWEPPHFGGAITSMILVGSRVVAVGDFNSAGGVPRQNIASVDDFSGAATPWNPGSDGAVRAFALGAQLYVAGDFNNIGGQSRSRLAALDIQTGLATEWNPQPDRNVSALRVGDSAVYAAGQFTTIGGQPRSCLAALDPNTGLATEWDPSVGASSSVSSLALSGSRLYVGGNFSQIGTQARSNLAAVDATTGTVLPWNPGPNREVRRLEVFGGVVYAAGAFVQVGGVSRVGLAAIHATTGIVTAWNPGPVNGQVQALAVSSSAIYVGGAFSSIGGVGRLNLASLDPGSGAPTSWDPGADANVTTLTLAGSRLSAGGLFKRIAGQDRSGFARFALEAPVVQLITPNGGESLFLGRPFNITWSATNDVAIESVDLQLSRQGPSGPWETIHTGGNTGSHPWTVTGPASNGQAYLRVVARSSRGDVGVDQSDGPFTITFDPSDVIAPIVQVLAPNGHETLFIGEESVLHWNVTDDVGVEQVDVYLSRSGPLGPWSLLYEDAEPIAHRTWMVTGPAVFDDAYLRIVARDHSGNIGTDMNDIAFTIADQSVPTLIDLFQAVPTSSGIRLEWRATDANAIQSIALERAVTTRGPWSSVNAGPVTDGQLSWVLDLDPPTSATQWYRLSGVRRDGRTFHVGPISVLAQQSILAFGLSALAPNPTAGKAWLSFDVPRRAVVRLALTDVQGRELAVLTNGPREPGRHAALLDASDLPMGIYFLDLEAEGVKLRRRVTVMR